MENENNPVGQPVNKVPTRTTSAASQSYGQQAEPAQPQPPYQQPYGQQADPVQPQSPYQQPTQPYGQPCQPQMPSQSNGLGIAGFVVSLCGLVLCWVPFLNIILGVTGLILSAYGMKRLPKGLATAGLVIGIITTVIAIIYIIVVIVAASAHHSVYHGYW